MNHPLHKQHNTLPRPALSLSIVMALLISNPSYADSLLCESYNGMPNSKDKHGGMVFIKGGTFTMGNNHGHKDHHSGKFEVFQEERHEHQVTIDDFWIDRHEVTNAQFAQFVKETGYVTVVERKPKKEWYPPGTPEADMIAGSAVFVPPKQVFGLHNHSQWWQYVHAANWRQPQGPGSSIKDKMNHPVVQITQEDAQAYAKWAGRSLPTEAQWEFAAKGGLTNKPYAWGDNFKVNGKSMANTWQGSFPKRNSSEDGYVGTAPVGCYPANGYGLYDMAGNVWEIVSDNYQSRHAKHAQKNPTGPKTSYDAIDPSAAKHVIKGGSYLCTPDYCMRYRPTARQGQDFTMGTSHVGFRTVLNRPQR